jgi:hypothetical protein
LADRLADLPTYYEPNLGAPKIRVRVSDTTPSRCA